jgi:glycosyltransferase involved in cell wall biosynthesis
MPESSRIERVLFIGSYLTGDIVRERGLPSLNVAGSNRSVRIAEALKAAGADVLLLSSATTLRQKWMKKIFHHRRETQGSAIKVIFPWSVGLPFLGALFEPLALSLGVKEAFESRQPTIVLLYNYYPGPLLAALLAKYFYGAKMILDIEDVCIPRVADWLGRGDARPVQQLAGWVLLKLGMAACDSVIVPSRRFLRAAQVDKRYTVVSGCIAVDGSTAKAQKDPSGPLSVLIGGKLDDEQGLGLVLEAMEILTGSRQSCERLDFHFCGFAEDERKLNEKLQALAVRGARVRYHGTLTSDAYRALLAQMDVCVAMQNPGGRHAEAKTPSKVYEYLAHGKAVIASDVGDFLEIPMDVVSICDWNAMALFRRLEEFASDREKAQRMGERAAEFAAAEYDPAVNGAKILSSLQ